MPLYEYQCVQCGERIEIIQRFSDPPYSHCPKCGSAMKKLLSAPAIQFKGTGFYKTDYGSGSSRGSSSAKGDAKTEAKSEAKSEGPSKKTD